MLDNPYYLVVGIVLLVICVINGISHYRRLRQRELDARYNQQCELTPAEVAALDAFLREQARSEER